MSGRADTGLSGHPTPGETVSPEALPDACSVGPSDAALTDEQGSLSYWRRRVLRITLLAMACLGTLAYVPSVWLSVREQVWSIVVADTFAWLWCLYLTFSPRLSYRSRSLQTLLLLYLLSVVLILVLEPVGAGRIWLFTVPIMASLLLGLQAGLVALALLATTLVALTPVLARFGTSVTAPEAFEVAAWLVVACNLTLLAALPTIAFGVIVNGLEATAGRLRESLDRLQEAGTERELLTARLREAEKLEAVGRLAGGVAHDFNNLLTVITGFNEAVLNDLPAGSQAREDSEHVAKAAERARDLTRQLLAFSRRDISEPRPVDLHTLTAETRAMLTRLLGKRVELSYNGSDEPVFVLADPGQMEQVLVNLVVNARDAMPDGGTITVRTQPIDLDGGEATHHLALTPGRYALLQVCDPGNGMDAATRERIFEPFFTTKERGSGTGLGLATVYGIIRQHGGQIACESELGHGTTFSIYLPRLDEAAAHEPAPTAGRDAPRVVGPATILLVEDEPGVRRLALRALERFGHRVLEAPDGETALQVAALHDGPIDLLLTDAMLPDILGHLVAARICEQRPGLRVIFMSGYAENVVADHGVLREGVTFLPKPFSVTTLRDLVERELAGSEAT